jgi:CheY-like chemotaxis protein
MMSTAEEKPCAMALAEVAHDLRAPLGGIEAMVEILAATGLSAEQSRIVAGLRAAASHLRDVASDIIDRERGAADARPERSERFSIATLADGIVTAADARARAKGLSFAADVGADASLDVVGDQRRIRRMLENLLDNAFKVTQQGEVALTIRLVDRRGAFAGLIFEVRDTGPGFGEAEKARLFRTFSRLDNGVQGSGMGLALVARMARAMGGDAGCSSRPGEGATFWFTLRLKLAECDAGESTANDCEAATAPVLVVDDNQANRIIMRAILEHFGHRVVDAETGEAALDIVRQTRLKAVMLDQTLPGMSGLETLASIRALDSAVRRLPVIPVTGRVAPEDKAAFAAAGANGFVEKPVTARAIRDALEAATMGPAEARAA